MIFLVFEHAIFHPSIQMNPLSYDDPIVISFYIFGVNFVVFALGLILVFILNDQSGQYLFVFTNIIIQKKTQLDLNLYLWSWIHTISPFHLPPPVKWFTFLYSPQAVTKNWIQTSSYCVLFNTWYRPLSYSVTIIFMYICWTRNHFLLMLTQSQMVLQQRNNS